VWEPGQTADSLTEIHQIASRVGDRRVVMGGVATARTRGIHAAVKTHFVEKKGIIGLERLVRPIP
jgi:hypothetical protein